MRKEKAEFIGNKEGVNMVMTILFALIMGIVLMGAGIYMLILLIYYALKPKNNDAPKEYIIVEPEETEEERQCREYGDCYGYSYYW